LINNRRETISFNAASYALNKIIDEFLNYTFSLWNLFIAE